MESHNSEIYKFSHLIDYKEKEIHKAFKVSSEFFDKVMDILIKVEDTCYDKNDIKEYYMKSIDENLEITTINELIFSLYVLVEAAYLTVKDEPYKPFLDIIDGVLKNNK